MCQARCCPRVGMRAMPSSEVASPIVVLLPFEMEYLIGKTGVSRYLFRRWPLALTPEATIEIGMLDLGKPCPFLKDNMQCSIHEHNPLDCRTFPLLPVLNYRRELEWVLGENCPSLALLSPKFVDAVKGVWRELLPVLPQAWWDLYAFADRWLGWSNGGTYPVDDAARDAIPHSSGLAGFHPALQTTSLTLCQGQETLNSDPDNPFERPGPHGATLHEVRADDETLLNIACDLFASIFPEDLRYLPYVRACAHGRHPSHPKTLDHVWLVSQGGEWVGLRVFSYIVTREFGHGAYIGFAPKARGLGLGHWLVEQTHAQLDLDARKFGKPGSNGYLVEVERLIDAKTDEERCESERRLQFHRQCGAVILPVPYIEPVMIESVDYLSPEDLQGESPRPMHLAFLPSARGREIQNLDLVDLIHGLYLDVYRLSATHEFVSHSLSYLIGERP